MNPIEDKTRALRRLTFLVAVPILLMSLIMIGPTILIRQTIDVTVTDVDAARTCRSYRSRIQGQKERSSRPESSLTYCGIVGTDHGSFELPQSLRFIFFQESREVFYDQLHEGCTYRVTVVGPGFELEKGRLQSNRNRTLVRLRPIGKCRRS